MIQIHFTINGGKDSIAKKGANVQIGGKIYMQ